MPAECSGKLKILVVDDDPMICDCIKMMLQFCGHDVHSENSAQAAFTVFVPNVFDIIFVDYSMPGMKGDELAVAIKAVAPKQPVIMVTGNAPACGSLPGVDYIVNKPVSLDDLKDAINRLSGETSFSE